MQQTCKSLNLLFAKTLKLVEATHVATNHAGAKPSMFVQLPQHRKQYQNDDVISNYLDVA